MSYLIKDEAVLQTFREIARGRGKTLADFLRDLAKQEAEKEAFKTTTMDRLRPVLNKARALGRNPQHIDWQEEKKASDDLWE